ncbi:MAG: hypothetical protein M3P53_05300 [Actinomycetota bacterium]|nr:hypothetical protein [Actinomycetota bacterium]
MTGYDAATGKWRKAVVSYVGGIAVTATCGAGVIVATGGIGVVGSGACVTAGVAAGQFLSSRVRDRR